MKFYQISHLMALLIAAHCGAASNNAVEDAPTQPPYLRRKMESTTSGGTVITLGDSYASGCGIYPDGNQYDEEFGAVETLDDGTEYVFTENSDMSCWRETDTTPGPLYAKDHHMESIFLACSSAKIAHVQNQFDYIMENPTWSTESGTGWNDSLLLVVAGGNDLRTSDGSGWIDVITECITEMHILTGCGDQEANQIANFDDVQLELEGLYYNICSHANNAKIRVMGYPKMMQRDPLCGSMVGIELNEADWIDEQLANANDMIDNAVTTVKESNPTCDIAFIPVDEYLPIGACGANEHTRHVTGIMFHTTFPPDISGASLHPSQNGYFGYYNALVANV